MRSILLVGAATLFFVLPVCGQTTAPGPAEFQAEKKLAQLTLEAHGGAKLKAMRSLVISGSVDVTTSAFNQAIAATFITIFSGDKYRLEINNPFQPIKQIYDGTQTMSSIRGGFTLPPINRLGLPLLPRIGETGFVVTPLPEKNKGKRGFRITSPEGYFTDYFIDEKTNQIKAYDSVYEINGRTVSTSVEVDKYRVVDGVVIPEKYAQRFDLDRLTAYAAFRAKEIQINSAVDDAVFAIAN